MYSMRSSITNGDLQKGSTLTWLLQTSVVLILRYQQKRRPAVELGHCLKAFFQIKLPFCRLDFEKAARKSAKLVHVGKGMTERTLSND